MRNPVRRGDLLSKEELDRLLHTPASKLSERDRASIRSVACPMCKAHPGELCSQTTDAHVMPVYIHADRVNDYLRETMKTPVLFCGSCEMVIVLAEGAFEFLANVVVDGVQQPITKVISCARCQGMLSLYEDASAVDGPSILKTI